MPETRKLYHEHFTEVAPNVFVGRGEIVVIGTPPRGEDEETGHNCDAMGCGWDHVLYRAWLATPTGSPTEAGGADA